MSTLETQLRFVGRFRRQSGSSSRGSGGQRRVLKFTEPEARARFLDLVVAFLGAQRKDKPKGVISARVFFDGTHGLAAINSRTRIRDQERSPVAADLKRALKEKGQIAKGSTVYVNTVGIFGMTSASYNWNRVGAAVNRISHHSTR